MKETRLSEVTWLYSDELSIHIGVHDELPNNSHADVVYAKLEPGSTLPLHQHSRPTPDGYEAFFFFAGAKLQLRTAEGARSIDTREPFHLTFIADELHGITNAAQEDLVFEVLCAPRHQDGEETVVD